MNEWESGTLKQSPTTNGYLPTSQSVNIPDKITCSDCSAKKMSNQTWWCRTCMKTICTHCNLLKGHTEHRSSPWSVHEMAQSLVNLEASRKTLRFRKAAEEEIAIKEYMRQVERYFVEKLHRMVIEQNQRDAELVAQTCDALRFDSKNALLLINSEYIDGGAILPLVRALDDNKFQRLLNQISDLFLSTNKRHEETPRFENFARDVDVLPTLSPEKFAQRLEEEALSPNLFRTEHNPTSKLPAAMSYRSLQLDAEKILPYSPDTAFTPDNKPKDYNDGRAAIGGKKEVIRRYVDQDFSQTSSPVLDKKDEIISADRNRSKPISTINRPQSSLGLTRGGSLSVAGRSISERLSLRGDNASTTSLAGLSASLSDRVSVTAYHFGDDYLTRPVDVCTLPEKRLAISDSMAGVYLTNWAGDVLNRIVVDGASVSSLACSPLGDRLFVGVLRRTGRSVQIYDATTLGLLDTLPCPEQPRIETSRSRWLCVTPRDQLYMVSGDNATSALWLWSDADRRWLTVHVSRETRYQYLTFVEHSDAQLSTFVTCDCLNNALRLLTARGDRILRDFGFERFYDLRPYVQSPAAARRDSRGNLLIVDYGDASGKVFSLEAPPNQPGADRRLKVLTEIGAREGMGIAACDGWCFIACLNKRLIKALQYAEI